MKCFYASPDPDIAMTDEQVVVCIKDEIRIEEVYEHILNLYAEREDGVWKYRLLCECHIWSYTKVRPEPI